MPSSSPVLIFVLLSSSMPDCLQSSALARLSRPGPETAGSNRWRLSSVICDALIQADKISRLVGVAISGARFVKMLRLSVIACLSTSTGVGRPKISSNTCTRFFAGRFLSTYACIPANVPRVMVTSSPGSGWFSTIIASSE